MEYEIERTVCRSCSGELSCTKMCEIHACKALINYISNIDTSETKIGTFGSRVYNSGKQDLVVSGHQVYGRTLEVVTILTDIKTNLDATKKLQNYCGRTVIQLLNSSREQLNLTVEEAQYIADFVSKLNSNKLVVVPFKPETVCVVSTPNGFSSETTAVLDSIIWKTNKENNKLEAFVEFRFTKESGVAKKVVYRMSEYLDKFSIKDLRVVTKGEKRDNSIIKITDYGIIKPIEVEYGDERIAVDSTYIYSIKNGIATIIGGWNPSGNLVVIENIENKAMTKIQENMSIIKSHRKYIAPYRMYESNLIEIK